MNLMLNKRFFVILLSVFLGCVSLMAQKSELHQRAEAEEAKQHVPNARSLYIRAFEGYVASLYSKEGLWKEAFDMLRQVDQAISSGGGSAASKAALRYQTAKERMQMYMRLRKTERIKEQLANMETQAERANDENVSNDLLPPRFEVGVDLLLQPVNCHGCTFFFRAGAWIPTEFPAALHSRLNDTL